MLAAKHQFSFWLDKEVKRKKNCLQSTRMALLFSVCVKNGGFLSQKSNGIEMVVVGEPIGASVAKSLNWS